MKKGLLNILILFTALFISFSLASCANDSLKDPKDIIAEQYGNKEYKIEFSNTTLKDPIPSISYTAKSIPTLPTPTRTGYIFQGWYFDSNYVYPYTSESLYLKMKNVTLYAKWEQEKFTKNGIYLVNYETKILEDTVEKGKLTDTYGGYADFYDFIDLNETYFEKSEDGLFLRLTYDNKYFASPEVFTVTLSSSNGSKFKLDGEKTIAVGTETKRTIYIDWKDNSLDTPLYFDINWYNVSNENIPASDLEQTRTKYKLEFNVTEFLGFSKSYVNFKKGLDDGIYSIRTIFHSQKNDETTMSSYFSAYAYLKLENGNYSLITNFKPKIFIGNGDKDDYYYERIMTFAPIRYIYGLGDDLPEGMVESDWYPGVYNAKRYYNMAVEFNSEEKKYYHIFDLGNELLKNYMLECSVTGMMELMTLGSYNYVSLIMSLDFDHILAIDESTISYKPLSGDSYEYNEELSFYPGAIADFADSSAIYEYEKNNGMTNINVNFFYSADNVQSSPSNSKIYSHRIEITPINNDVDIALNRYNFAHFNMNARIYGYDGTKDLYADSYTTNIAGGGMRERTLVTTGKSFKIGDNIDVINIWNTTFGINKDINNMTYKVYDMNNYKIDYSSEQNVNSSFAFSRSSAIVYKYIEANGDISTCVYELALYSAPNYNFVSNNGVLYDEANNTYNSGEEVKLPNIEYTWMQGGTVFNYCGGDIYGIKYVAGLYDTQYITFNHIYMKVYQVTDEGYSSIPISYTKDGAFYMPDYDIVYVFGLINRYREYYFVETPFNLGVGDNYVLYKDGIEIKKGTLKNQYSGQSQRLNYNNSYEYSSVYKDNFHELFNLKYTIEENSGTYDFKLFQVKFLGKEKELSFYSDDFVNDEEFITNVKNYISTEEYGYITVYYQTEVNDKITISALYETYFGGKREYRPLDYNTIFTDTVYSFKDSMPKLPNGNNIASDYSYKVYSIKDGNALSTKAVSIYNEDGNDKILFNLPGLYRIDLIFLSYKDENGEQIYDREGYSVTTRNTIFYTVSQFVEVTPKDSIVSITFHTDNDHPFKEEYGGGLTYTLEFNLVKDNIYVLDSNYFETFDKMVGLVDKEYATARYASILVPGQTISSFISRFNTNSLDLYVRWNVPVNITITTNIDIDGFPVGGISKTFYMEAEDQLIRTESNSTYYVYRGYYNVNLSQFVNELKQYEKNGIVFEGFTGGFVGNDVKLGGLYNIIESREDDYYKITAVFRKLYTVKFNLRATNDSGEAYTETRLPSVSVYNGDLVPTPTKEIVCEIDGYEFKYWAYKDEFGNLIEWNLSNPVEDYLSDSNGVITLYAVFGEI